MKEGPSAAGAQLVAIIAGILAIVGSFGVWARWETGSILTPTYTYTATGMDLDGFYDWLPKGLIALLTGVFMLGVGLAGRLGLGRQSGLGDASYGLGWAAFVAGVVSIWAYFDDVGKFRVLGFGLILTFIAAVLCGVAAYVWRQADNAAYRARQRRE